MPPLVFVFAVEYFLDDDAVMQRRILDLAQSFLLEACFRSGFAIKMAGNARVFDTCPGRDGPTPLAIVCI